MIDRQAAQEVPARPQARPVIDKRDSDSGFFSFFFPRSPRCMGGRGGGASGVRHARHFGVLGRSRCPRDLQGGGRGHGDRGHVHLPVCHPGPAYPTRPSPQAPPITPGPAPLTASVSSPRPGSFTRGIGGNSFALSGLGTGSDVTAEATPTTTSSPSQAPPPSEAPPSEAPPQAPPPATSPPPAQQQRPQRRQPRPQRAQGGGHDGPAGPGPGCRVAVCGGRGSEVRR